MYAISLIYESHEVVAGFNEITVKLGHLKTLLDFTRQAVNQPSTYLLWDTYASPLDLTNCCLRNMNN